MVASLIVVGEYMHHGALTGRFELNCKTAFSAVGIDHVHSGLPGTGKTFGSFKFVFGRCGTD